jgi:hypothetical protein
MVWHPVWHLGIVSKIFGIVLSRSLRKFKTNCRTAPEALLQEILQVFLAEAQKEGVVRMPKRMMGEKAVSLITISFQLNLSGEIKQVGGSRGFEWGFEPL